MTETKTEKKMRKKRNVFKIKKGDTINVENCPTFICIGLIILDIWLVILLILMLMIVSTMISSTNLNIGV